MYYEGDSTHIGYQVIGQAILWDFGAARCGSGLIYN